MREPRGSSQRTWSDIARGLAGAAMAVGFFWAIFAGWDDLPTAVAVPFGVGCVTLIVLSLRDLAGRYSRR